MNAARRLVLLSGIGLLGLILIFQVPYHFPPAVRTISASYDYGFNNTVGIVLVGVVAAIFLGAGFLTGPAVHRMRLFSRGEGEQLVSLRDLAWCGGASMLVVAFVGALSGNFGFSESKQFIQAMERLSLGQSPYVDFDFYYGPLLAYLPYGFYRLGELAGLSLKESYFLTLLVLQLVGLLELRYLLNAMDLRDSWRRRVFFAVALSTLPLHSGINLILLRYITPVVGFLFLKGIERAAAWQVAAALGALSFLTFGISVEFGMVFAVATSVYYGGLFLMELRVRHLACLATALIAPLLFGVAFPGLFHTVQLYLLGAWRWPFVPSLALLLFFGAVLLLAFTAGRHLREIRQHYFFLCLCLLAFGGLPAALGRCDPGHVLLNGLGVLLLAFGALAGFARPRMVAAMGLLWVLVYGVLYNASSVVSYRAVYASLTFRLVARHIPPQQLPRLVDAAARLLHMDTEEARRKFENFTAAQGRDNTSLFVGIDRVAAPYQPSDDIARHLRESGKIEFLYFKDYAILASDLEVEWAIRDLAARQPEFLILPITWNQIAQAQDDASLINLLFSTKYLSQPVRNGRALLTTLVNYIGAHYAPQRQDGDFVIMRRSTTDQGNRLEPPPNQPKASAASMPS